ncbi:spore germination protein [Cytobacillus spongiae]|uniref:spore germination protein n=1 Tax=Cytobacillus spongiae TaxID=2901381 RepID=UPI001F28843B|nr:spore germination protein [Cytobacillus spongiae]UII54313.1 spore germination protein [Cytobacillus spongiae]
MKKTKTNSNQAHKGQGRILIDELTSKFAKAQDFIMKKHSLEDEDSLPYFYFESLIDLHFLNQYILPKIRAEHLDSAEEQLHELFQVEVFESSSLEDLKDLLFSGKIIFILPHKVVAINAGKLSIRLPEESSLETSIRGPKDGFVEDFLTNISLVRRRLKTSSLSIEKYTIGKRSNTKVALLYLDDVIDHRIITEVHKRLEKINVDILVSVHDLEQLIGDRPYSFFPGFDFTGRPDFVVEALNQGRFALIVDGNPTVTFAPVNILLLTKSPEDSYIGYGFVSLERMIRMIGIMISAFLPGLWVSFSAYNVDQIPYLLLATVSVARFGLPFSAPMEMFIVLFLFELFNEAGIRLPRAIGQTVAVLGGLIVGDAAIRAGLTSPTMLVVAAITYISSFTLVNHSLSSAITILRFIILLLSTFLGLFGLLIGYILTLIYFSSISSFGVPYLAPLAPISIKEVIKSLLKAPKSFYKSRTATTNPNDSTREGG